MEPKPGFLNIGMTINDIQQPLGYKDRFDHYDSWGLFWKKPIYEITIVMNHPLMYRDVNGKLWMTDKHFWTDFGSTPPPMQSIPGLDRELHRFPYLFHDNDYQEKGLWCSEDEGKTWKFVKLSRMQSDLLLYEMVKYDINPGGLCNRISIFAGVRLGGYFNYGKGDYAKKKIKMKNIIDNTKPPIEIN